VRAASARARPEMPRAVPLHGPPRGLGLLRPHGPSPQACSCQQTCPSARLPPPACAHGCCISRAGISPKARCCWRPSHPQPNTNAPCGPRHVRGPAQVRSGQPRRPRQGLRGGVRGYLGRDPGQGSPQHQRPRHQARPQGGRRGAWACAGAACSCHARLAC
jgi:hypothetical protein